MPSVSQSQGLSNIKQAASFEQKILKRDKVFHGNQGTTTQRLQDSGSDESPAAVAMKSPQVRSVSSHVGILEWTSGK